VLRKLSLTFTHVHRTDELPDLARVWAAMQRDPRVAQLLATVAEVHFPVSSCFPAGLLCLVLLHHGLPLASSVFRN